MKPIVLELADGLGRLALNSDHGIDLAALHFLQSDPLLDIDEIRLGSEPLEYNQGRHEGSAVGQTDADGLAIEILEAADRFRRDDMHLFIIKLGHVGEFFLDVLRQTFFFEIIERVSPHEPEIDARKKKNVGAALDGAAADNRKHAQLIPVVED